MPYPWDTPDHTTWPDMNYLLSEAAQSRYALAAYHLRKCECIVEIGGFKTPITRYVHEAVNDILVLDPKIDDYDGNELQGLRCRIRHRRSKFQDFDYADLQPGYGFVLLGYSVKYFSDDAVTRRREWGLLVDLVRNARLAVLEYAVAWPLGADSVAQLIAESDKEILVDIQMDLGASPEVDTEHSLRRYLLLG